jgi:Concanavalin A-like lectin/glucanases superfamily
MAYSFTAASNQYLSVPDTASLDITGAITLAAWVKSSGSYGTRGIVSKFETGTNNRSYALYTNATGNIVAAFSPSGSGVNTRSDTGSTILGTNWRHVAVTFVPSTSVTLYVDGAAESATNNGNSIPSSLFSGSANLWIGTVSATTFGWDGSIAEAAIYSAALPASEIASLAKGMTCDKVRPQSLVFYAPLVRDLIDARGGRAITNNNGATVANHPRVYA